MNTKMDIVYLVKQCQTNDELTYSLRSLKNLPHNRVFIVGGCPTNINKSKIIYKPILQNQSKYKNTTYNLKQICQDKDLSDDFILMNDDFFVLKPISDLVNELNLCRGTIKDVLADYKSRYGVMNDYTNGMKQTMIFLQDIGILEPLSYELHIPMIINKQKFLKMFELPYINSIKVLHKRSLYGNLYNKDSKPILDVKVLASYFLPLGSDKFLSTEDNSWPIVKTYVGRLFPNKCEYEI